MSNKEILQDLKAEIVSKMLDRYDAGNHTAFEVSAFILSVIDQKIKECGGE